eukprot:403063-Rhodomonas_salina.1
MMGSLMEHKEMLGGVPRWKQVSAVQALNLQQLNGQSNGISSPTLSSPTGSSLTIAQVWASLLRSRDTCAELCFAPARSSLTRLCWCGASCNRCSSSIRISSSRSVSALP